MSSRCRGVLVEVSVQGAVAGGVVGDVVLPAAPDDGGPGTGKDANGVRVAHAAGAGSGVDVGGPGVGVAGVVGEVGQRSAEFGVGGVAEADGAVFAGFEGDRAGAGRCGQ